MYFITDGKNAYLTELTNNNKWQDFSSKNYGHLFPNATKEDIAWFDFVSVDKNEMINNSFITYDLSENGAYFTVLLNGKDNKKEIEKELRNKRDVLEINFINIKGV